MTETFTIPTEAPVKNGKKAVNPNPQAFETEISSGPKKVRVRKGNGAGPLEIPANILETLGANQIDLQWVVDSINGMPVPQEKQKYTINGWEPVTGQMFQGMFDGMFMPKGYQGEINVGGQILMWRPMELSKEALDEMHAEARRPVEMTERKVRLGQVDGVTLNSNNQQVLNYNKASRQVVRGDIPIPD